jgi:cytidylate kinase
MSSDDADSRREAAATPPPGDPPRPARNPAVVTVAALHGARGSVVAPRVAERLGVRFLDRAIPTSVAQRAGLPEEAVEAVDERPRSAADRLVWGLARVANSSTASERDPTRVEFEQRRLHGEIEEFLAHASLSGGVVLGRAGAVVLADVPGALHVYLGGPQEARIQAIVELEGVDRDTAEREVKAHDRARRNYVQGAYGVDGDDPSLYHLMLDATALDVDACVELIVAASKFRTGT